MRGEGYLYSSFDERSWLVPSQLSADMKGERQDTSLVVRYYFLFYNEAVIGPG
jgi:hypothetical protein